MIDPTIQDPYIETVGETIINNEINTMQPVNHRTLVLKVLVRVCIYVIPLAMAILPHSWMDITLSMALDYVFTWAKTVYPSL